MAPQSGLGVGSKATTRHPKPTMIRANTVPILPVPTTPTVLSCTPRPISPSRAKLASLTRT